MKKIKYFLATSILVFIHCTDINTNEIEQHNIDFITSLENKDNKKQLHSIDSILLANKQNDNISALLYLKKGALLSKANDFEKATKNLNLALPYFKKTEDKKHLAKTYWLLGNANAHSTRKVIANKQLIIALQYSKETEDKQMEANIYSSLAYTHYLLQDYPTCVGYTKKSAEIYRTLNDSIQLSSAYSHLAILYKNMGQFSDALNYNTKSLEISQLKADSIGIGKTYSNIGRLFEFQGDSKKAMEYYRLAAKNNETATIKNSIPYRNIGDIYYNNKNYAESERYYLKAKKIEENNKLANSSSLNNIYGNLLSTAIFQNDFKKAYQYQLEADSLANINLLKNNEEKISAVEAQYELFRQEKELEQQKKINTKNRIIFIVLALLILAAALYFIQKNKISKLKLSKEKILLEHKVLRSQMNPHFIFNALSSIQNSLMDNDPIKSAGYLSKFAKLIRQNFDFIDRKTITLAEEKNMLENYIKTQQLRFNDKFSYTININKSIDIYTTEIPPLLLQPFIENAIEHGFKNTTKKGRITLNINRDNNAISYEIIDNGKGYSTRTPDGNTHSIDVFKKRLKLIGNADEKSFKIKSSEEGTTIKFCLKQ